MTSETEMYLQQCRIYQNKDKEPIALSYANNANFYKTIDRYVFEGFKLRISFPLEKLTEDSLLFERMIACYNGQDLTHDYESYYASMQEILAFSSQDQFKDTLARFPLSNNIIYKTYMFTYDGKNIIMLAPAGEGLPSQSFTVDLS